VTVHEVKRKKFPSALLKLDLITHFPSSQGCCSESRLWMP